MEVVSGVFPFPIVLMVRATFPVTVVGLAVSNRIFPTVHGSDHEMHVTNILVFSTTGTIDTIYFTRKKRLHISIQRKAYHRFTCILIFFSSRMVFARKLVRK